MTKAKVSAMLLSNKAIYSLIADELTRLWGTKPPTVIDLALLGSTSGHYGWHNSSLVDADLWIFTRERTHAGTLAWIADVARHISSRARTVYTHTTALYAAVDGPYKPTPSDDGQHTLFIHLLIDDERSYTRRSRLTRYSWRKYKCIIDPARLLNLSPPRPTISDLVSEPWGVKHCISMLDCGVVEYPELALSEGTVQRIAFGEGTFQFVEFCLYACLTSARNRARVDGFDEADKLSTEQFAHWYAAKYSDRFVLGIAERKLRIRSGGYKDLLFPALRNDIADWCRELLYDLTEANR